MASRQWIHDLAKLYSQVTEPDLYEQFREGSPELLLTHEKQPCEQDFLVHERVREGSPLDEQSDENAADEAREGSPDLCEVSQDEDEASPGEVSDTDNAGHIKLCDFESQETGDSEHGSRPHSDVEFEEQCIIKSAQKYDDVTDEEGEYSEEEEPVMEHTDNMMTSQEEEVTSSHQENVRKTSQAEVTLVMAQSEDRSYRANLSDISSRYGRDDGEEARQTESQDIPQSSSRDGFDPPSDWRSHRLATSPPETIRIEDTLPEFQPSRGSYKKQNEKTKHPVGVMIMDEEGSSEGSSRAPSVSSSDEDENNDCNNQHAYSVPFNLNVVQAHMEESSEYEVKPSHPFGSLRNKYSEQGATGDMTCAQCGKRVYEMEKMIADSAIYHKMCFKCQHCKRILSLGNFASIDKQLYCKPHFLELFKTKGNYDEGFGKERSTRHFQNHNASFTKEDSAPLENGHHEENNLTASQELDAREITRAEDKVDEGLTNLPSIKSIKNRFETTDSPTQANRSRKNSRQSENSDAGSTNGDFRAGSRKQSKWDKPKDPPPPPINRMENGENGTSDAADDAESTSTRISRFRQLEKSDDQSSHRKPMHKMTPPRDELGRDIEEAAALYEESQQQQAQSDTETEEMQLSTKSMLARFRSMEEENAAPPSPSRESYKFTTTTSSATKTSSTARRTQHSQLKSSPDSGCQSDNEILDGRLARSDDDTDVDMAVMTRSTDVIRSEDQTEEILPEAGLTKSLLAQWKQKETSPAPSAASSVRSAPRHVTRNVPRTRPAYTPDSEPETEEHVPTTVNGDSEDFSRSSEVMRECDRNETDELPQSGFARNMLAKFQSMEEEAQRDATHVRGPAKKKAPREQKAPKELW